MGHHRPGNGSSKPMAFAPTIGTNARPPWELQVHYMSVKEAGLALYASWQGST